MAADGETDTQSSSAATRVFETTELLELILLESPAYTILTSQRVTRFWKATIVGSKPLQKVLYKTSIVDLNKGTAHLLAKSSFEGIRWTNTLQHPIMPEASMCPPENRIVNPFLRKVFQQHHGRFKCHLKDSIFSADQQALASWESMYISQAPRRFATLVPETAGMDDEEAARIRVRKFAPHTPTGRHAPWLCNQIEAELRRGGYDTKPFQVEAKNGYGVAIGEVVAVLPEVINRGKRMMAAIHGEEGVMRFSISV